MDLAVPATAVADLDAELAALYPLLVRRLALVLGNAADAEDVAQSALERAVKAQGRFTGGSVHAWVLTIGLRLAFNELRRRRRHARPFAGTPAWVMASDVDLWEALATIEPRHRAVLLLNVLDGYTHQEIGRMLEVPTGTVASWISRTKETLRTRLGEEHDGPV